jgi:adenylylsulfate kinase
MLLLQMTGLSGAGKSTIAQGAQRLLEARGLKVEIIDGDEYRKVICKDLGFSEEDRKENIRRLSFIGNVLARNDVIAIIAAINPYEEIRKEVERSSKHVRTIWIHCALAA